MPGVRVAAGKVLRGACEVASSPEAGVGRRCAAHLVRFMVVEVIMSYSSSYSFLVGYHGSHYLGNHFVLLKCFYLFASVVRSVGASQCQ